jgi:hypothetical protein
MDCTGNYGSTGRLPEAGKQVHGKYHGESGKRSLIK